MGKPAPKPHLDGLKTTDIQHRAAARVVRAKGPVVRKSASSPAQSK